MKKPLQFQFEWEDPLGARGPELRATWARLEIRVDDVPVSRVIDERNRSIRDAVYGPLYPVAEWIAMNWWSLFHEVEAPGTMRWKTYPRRHSLAAAGEGFALPDLRVVPTGKWTELRWSNRSVEEAGITFVNAGGSTLASGEVRHVLTEFVGSVLARLESQGIGGTPLQEEWDALQSTPPEEAAFCQAAAALGQDPYAMESGERDHVFGMSKRVPMEIFGEFASAIDFWHLEESLENLEAIMREAANADSALSSVRELAERHLAGITSSTPWGMGYECARNLRKHLGLNGHSVATDRILAEALQIDEGGLFRNAPGLGTSHWGIDAILVPASNENPIIFTSKPRGDSRRFAFCRALYDSIAGASTALVSRARSDSQQANRAFAAEFLAPAALIRERLAQESAEDGQIDDLADEFGVSAMVIRHQIENHKIAHLVG